MPGTLLKILKIFSSSKLHEAASWMATEGNLFLLIIV